jgi:hypothetical protein
VIERLDGMTDRRRVVIETAEEADPAR